MTHAYLGLAALNLVYLAVGGSLLYGLGLVRRRRADLRYLGLALFAGWALSTFGFGLASSVGVDVGLGELAVQSCVFVAAGVALGRRLPPLEEIRGPASVGLVRAVAAVGGLVLAVSFGCALILAWRSGADSTWDVWAFWLPKAKAIYYFHGLDTGLSGFTTYVSPGYPPAMPATAAVEFHVMGGTHAMLLPVEAALLGAAFAGSAVVLLRRHVAAWLLLPPLAMLSLAPEFWNRIGTILPDQSIGYLLALAMVAAVLWLEERNGRWLVLATVLLAAATLTKVEGFLLGLALAATAAGAGLLVRRDYRGLALFLGPAAMTPWELWLSRHHLTLTSGDYDRSDAFDPGYLGSHLGRLSYASHHLVDLVFSLEDWKLVVPVALVAAAAAARVRPALSALVVTWLVLAFAALACVYWVGTLDIHWWVATSAQRVVGTLPIVAGTLAPLLASTALGASPRPERTWPDPDGTTYRVSDGDLTRT